MSKEVNFRHISEYQSPEQSPGYLLWRVSMKWRNTIEKVLKQFNLTHPQFVVLTSLAWLTKDGKKVSQVDIGRMAGLDPNTMSQIVRGLEKKNMIERTQSVDERSKNPMVTDFGGKVLVQALQVVEESDRNFFGLMKDHERDVLIQNFKRLMIKF